jgi:hypothetical protein
MCTEQSGSIPLHWSMFIYLLLNQQTSDQSLELWNECVTGYSFGECMPRACNGSLRAEVGEFETIHCSERCVVRGVAGDCSGFNSTFEWEYIAGTGTLYSLNFIEFSAECVSAHPLAIASCPDMVLPARTWHGGEYHITCDERCVLRQSGMPVQMEYCNTYMCSHWCGSRGLECLSREECTYARDYI